MNDKVYLYWMDKKSKEIFAVDEGELSGVYKKVAFVKTLIDGRTLIYKAAPAPGTVSDFKGPTVRLWLNEFDKPKAYRLFMAFFVDDFKKELEKMDRLIDECEKEEPQNDDRS